MCIRDRAGIVLSPAVGAILMSGSTVVVAINAQLLRRLDLCPTGDAAAASTGGSVPGEADGQS